MGRHLLLVDDNEQLTQLYMESLEKYGYSVFPSHNLSSCMEILRSKRIDLILLDLMMKPLDGWQILERIHEDTSLCSVPVIVVTGKVLLPEEVIKYGPSIDGFLKKPFLQSTLQGMISRSFEWMDQLNERCKMIRENGGDELLVEKYSSLSRQIKGLDELISFIKPDESQKGFFYKGDDLNESYEEMDRFIKKVKEELIQVTDLLKPYISE